MEARNVKGTKDIYGSDSQCYQYVENLMKGIAELFNYNEMRPPVLEHSEVFVRGVGEGSDVVRKEMYTFDDKGGRSLTLRPEFTAGIMRLIVQNKLYATSDLPIKAYYLGNVFRYERPQLGRYRQFEQFGVENVGSSSYLSDVDVIALAYTILQTLGLEDIKVKINTLGDEESRNAYKAALKEYFADKVDSMCDDCKERYNLNPLRILDCKVPEDQEIVKGAPKMLDYISIPSKQRFDNVLESLESLQIPFEVDDTLVRGLDYYSETVFEFHYTSNKGTDYGALGAGGHYDKLVAEMGGPDLSGVGFSFGIERIISVMVDDGLLDDVADACEIYVLPMSEETKQVALELAMMLRCEMHRVEVNLEGGKIGNQIKKAVKHHAELAIIIGEDELKNGTVIIKKLNEESQEVVPVDNIVEYIDGYYDAMHQHHHHEGCCCEGEHEDDDEDCGCGCGGHHHHDN